MRKPTKGETLYDAATEISSCKLPDLRTMAALWARSHRPDLPGPAGRPAAEPDDSISNRSRDAGHVRNAQRRQGRPIVLQETQPRRQTMRAIQIRCTQSRSGSSVPGTSGSDLPLNKAIKSRAIGSVSENDRPSVPEILGHRQRRREASTRATERPARWNQKRPTRHDGTALKAPYSGASSVTSDSAGVIDRSSLRRVRA